MLESYTDFALLRVELNGSVPGWEEVRAGNRHRIRVPHVCTSIEQAYRIGSAFAEQHNVPLIAMDYPAALYLHGP
jgi:hypothetical protein